MTRACSSESREYRITSWRGGNTRPSSVPEFEGPEVHGHEHHSQEEADDCLLSARVLESRRQQFMQRDPLRSTNLQSR